MSYISDFKSAPISLFGVNGGNTTTDSSLATLVGVRFQSGDGREFVLVQNAGSALAAGVVVQGPAPVSGHDDCAVASAAATGATSVTITLGATAVTANQYQGGYAVVSAGTNAGLTLKVKSHLAATASGSLVVNLEDALSGNLDTSTSKITLTPNPYGSQNGAAITTNGVIIAPSGTTTGDIIGVSFYPIAASSSTAATYGWIQSKGPVACLAAGTATAGLGCMVGAVNGAVSVHVAASNAQIGRFITTAEDTQKELIFIDC